jgi:hypothetical protein
VRYGTQRTVRCVGEVVPLSEVNVGVTVMIVAPAKDDTRVPIGTGFVTAVALPIPGKGFGYVVTAAHIARFAPSTFVRVTLASGGILDVAVPQWSFHDDGETDVAVAPMTLDRSVIRYVPTVIDHDVDPSRPPPRLGETVYFVGLLANIQAMHPANVPMVRSGTLGRLYQEGVRIRWPDGTIHTMVAHLIDSRAHRGFSGSPCYVQLEPRGRTDITNNWDTYLLGLVTGHLDEIGFDQSVMNTGVALVTPVEEIWHVLMREELVANRQRQIDEYEANTPEPTSATADSIGSGLVETAELMGKLLQVPKEEADDIHRGHP